MVSPVPCTGNGRRPRSGGRGWVLACALFAGTPGAAGARQTEPPDTYRDAAARTLVHRARDARDRDIEGMSSYEGVIRERIYMGLTALRFRRERGLFEQERIARLRWSADGERVLQWLGARRAIPIVGADTRVDTTQGEGRTGLPSEEISEELRSELPEELLSEMELPAFVFDPAGDRMAFGDGWALHPLSDTAAAHYRFASGDTLRLRIPSEDRDIVLQEVRVEPRRADFNLVAGSLWFDAETASLVRATYKPARPFDLSLDEPEEEEDVPGFLKPIQAEIAYITVEYSLQEFRYWLPRRFALEGEARLGNVVTLPLTVEWNVGQYSVNEATSEIPIAGPLPAGWSRREERLQGDDGTVSYVTVVVPQAEDLVAYPELSESFGERAPTAFTDGEVDELRGELDALLPTFQLFRPRVAWGWERGMLRYNRVEGLSAGVASNFPLGSATALDVQARIGVADLEPNAEISLTHGRSEASWTLSAYHRLESMNPWDNPFSLKNSIASLTLGIDRGQFVRTTGASLGYARSGRSVRWTLAAFRESERPVELGTDFFLTSQIRNDTLTSVLTADSLDQTGVRGELHWFAGLDPNGLILTGAVYAELSTGEADVQRTAATLSASGPLFGGVAGALELGAGAVWRDEPLQADFFIGGSATLRGLSANAVHGSSFWRARAEVANAFPGARLAAFTDLGWAGPREEFTLDDPYVSVGVGASFLDGLFRVDLARTVRRIDRWKLHLYLDGLF